MQRFRFVVMVVILGVTFGMQSWRPLTAQDAADCRTPRAACDGFDRFSLFPSNSPTWSPQMIRDSGRPIVPVFEGWFQNDDGSYTLSFGYISMNLEEALHTPLGPDNFIEPREFDGGQPTHFKEIHQVIRRPWNNFMIRVPADFGDKRVVWTLRNHGETYSTPGHISESSYMIETPTAPARQLQGTASGYAPMLRLDPFQWRADHEYWQLEQDHGWGLPDMIITSPPFTVPANSGDQWWEPNVPITDVINRSLPEGRWVRAVETRPGDAESGYVFHHANTRIHLATDEEQSYGTGLSSSAVGKRTDMYPVDAGKQLLPDDKIHFSLHLFPIGREVADGKIQVGVWLYPKGDEPKYTTNDETTFNSGEGRDLGLPRYTDLLIPPHGYQLLRGNFVLEKNTRIHSIRGHMHLRGGYQMMEAIYPDGRREVINKIDWNHLWYTTRTSTTI